MLQAVDESCLSRPLRLFHRAKRQGGSGPFRRWPRGICTKPDGVTSITSFRMHPTHNESRRSFGRRGVVRLGPASPLDPEREVGAMGNRMTARATATMHPEPCATPLRMRVYAAAPRAAHAPHAGNTVAGETASAAGCLRGLGWGLAIEGSAALLIYGIWRVVLVLR